MRNRLSTILLLPALMYSHFTLAAEPAIKTEWELGASLAALDFRLYPGSRQTKTYVLPLPYFTLRSQYLEIDRGIRGLLPLGPDWHLDISADLGLPVDSDDSRVRAGMPDLDAIVQLGPSLEYSMLGGRHQPRELRLELPLRAAIALNLDKTGDEGWLFEPRLVYEMRRTGRSGLFAKVKAGVRYASADYHAYYYDVAPAFVTPQRAGFESDKGYSGFVLDVHASWRQDNILFWGIVRYQNLGGAVFEHSPLVEDKNYYLAVLGVSWIFAHNQ